MPAQRALIGELDTYRDKGAPQPTKHLRAIHDGYRQRIHGHVGLHVDPRVNVRLPKVPEPWAYGGEEKVGWGISSDGSVSTDTVGPTLMGTV